MAWQTRVIDASEAERYDAYIAQAPKGNILQSYGWGQVKARTGWRPLYMVVEDGSRIVAAALFLKRSLPVGGKCILYSPRGPVFDLNNFQLFDYFLDQVRWLGRQQRAILWKIDPDVPSSNHELTAYLKSHGFRPAASDSGFEGTQPRYVFRLDISPSPDQLLASFHPKTRYNIRLSQRRGVTVRQDCTNQDLKTFYTILTETAERDGFLIRGASYFEAIWEELGSRDQARLFLAEYQDKPIAGALAFTIGDKAWYIYGASLSQHRNVMPNHLVQWTVINWAKERGCVMYDFRGVPVADPGHPLYGLYRFKKGFNGDYTEFVGEYDLVLSPAWYAMWQVGLPRYYRLIHSIAHRKKSAAAPVTAE